MIRTARAEEADKIAALLRRSIAELCAPDHGGDPVEIAAWQANKTEENVASWIGRADLIALVEEGPKGVAVATRAGRLMLLYVAPEARFTGVSARLLSAIEDIWRKAGLTEATLESTRTAERFYQARGWRAVGDGTDGLEMSKRL